MLSVIEEIWVDIKEYEGLYQISNMGRVRNSKNKIKKSRVTKSGYVIIDLNKDKHPQTFYVHRLVAEAFIPNPDNKLYVDHIDTNKENNNVNNLRWATAKENMNNELTKKHNSESSKGRIISEETKKKISEAQKGDKHWNYGNTWDEEVKKQNMLSQPTRKIIRCIETNIIYDSIAEVSRKTGINTTSIGDCVKGKQKTAGGYHWEVV